MSIKDAIIRHHRGWDYLKNTLGSPRGLLFFELRSKTGFTFGEPQRIDAFHIDDTPSKGLRRTAYEIKVSRSDFLAEVRNPVKRRFAVSMSNEFYFIAPPGIIGIEEVPLECGLIEVDGNDWEYVVKAPWRDSARPTWIFVAAIARALRHQYEIITRTVED